MILEVVHVLVVISVLVDEMVLPVQGLLLITVQGIILLIRVSEIIILVSVLEHTEPDVLVPRTVQLSAIQTVRVRHDVRNLAVLLSIFRLSDHTHRLSTHDIKFII